jgi:hypothetical protein
MAVRTRTAPLPEDALDTPLFVLPGATKRHLRLVGTFRKTSSARPPRLHFPAPESSRPLDDTDKSNWEIARE